jgi:probable F420-dependent oxidoreductase
MKIRVAVASTNTPVDPDDLAGLVDGLEGRRFDTLWLSDTPLSPAVQPLLALAMAAAGTTRLKLGTNVVVPGRNPMLLAKELAHLDRLSRGRLLLAFMPGIGSRTERAALGAGDVDRLALLADTIELCRRWWAGQPVTGQQGAWRFDGVVVGPRPVQDPLEIWLGGNGPKSLALTGTHGDGWLASRATPAMAESGRAAIEAAAVEAGRTIDDDHFGISIPYSRTAVDDATVALVMARAEGDREDILPIGPDELKALLQRHLDAGLTKFVLRPMSLVDGWEAELDFLAEYALPFQN